MKKRQHPNIAPGMEEDSNELERRASADEVAKGQSTRVTKLVLDETEPSPD
ncbi:hypothetical protein LLE49_04930 [Alicyclobacillus tolerans]|uniref:hypothetical protein n=1 Tax=Alicyclobacillus tolerans TaxID=90970 RepID=UPI001F45A774|nr:hypothetical protein [Alicyclobacillus tolerans]MCF8564082.1 hypothetical protein [Alicyclobacillus tolerans]